MTTANAETKNKPTLEDLMFLIGKSKVPNVIKNMTPNQIREEAKLVQEKKSTLTASQRLLVTVISAKIEELEKDK